MDAGRQDVLATCTIIFVLQQIFEHVAVDSSIDRVFGLTPYLVTHHLYVWQLVTYIFLHGGFFHILFNMFALAHVRRGTRAALGHERIYKVLLYLRHRRRRAHGVGQSERVCHDNWSIRRHFRSVARLQECSFPTA